MILLKRSDLKYTYKWKSIPEDDPRISGDPDTTLFNRNEGLEVLYLINKFLELFDINSIEIGEIVEKLIREEIPGNLRSQIHAFEWLLTSGLRSQIIKVYREDYLSKK